MENVEFSPEAEDQFARRVMANLRKAYADYTRAVRESARKTYPTASAANDWPVMGTALAAKATATLDNLGRLLRGQSTLDAWVLTRSLFETVVTFAWLAGDPTERMQTWRGKSAGTMLRIDRSTHAICGIALLGDSDDARALREALTGQTDEAGSRMPPVLDMARAADARWSDSIAAHLPLGWDMASEPERAVIGRLWMSFEGMYELVFRGGSAASHADYWLTREYFTKRGRGFIASDFADTDVALAQTAFGAWEVPYLAALELYDRLAQLTEECFRWPNPAAMVIVNVDIWIRHNEALIELGFGTEAEWEKPMALLREARDRATEAKKLFDAAEEAQQSP